MKRKRKLKSFIIEAGIDRAHKSFGSMSRYASMIWTMKGHIDQFLFLSLSHSSKLHHWQLSLIYLKYQISKNISYNFLWFLIRVPNYYVWLGIVSENICIWCNDVMCMAFSSMFLLSFWFIKLQFPPQNCFWFWDKMIAFKCKPFFPVTICILSFTSITKNTHLLWDK